MGDPLQFRSFFNFWVCGGGESLICVSPSEDRCHEGMIMRRSLISEILTYVGNSATTVRFLSFLLPSSFVCKVHTIEKRREERGTIEAVMSMAQTGGRQESEDTSREAENDRDDSLESTPNPKSTKKQRGRSWGDSRSSLGLYIPLAPITIERRTQQNLLLATVHASQLEFS